MQPPDVDSVEQKQIEAKGHHNFLMPPDEGGIRWIKRKKDGSCHFLNEHNQCSIYPVRPAVCKLEPFTIVDYDFQKNSVELDLNYPFACACEGVSETGQLQIKEIAKAAQIMLQKILLLTAVDLDLPPNNKKVKIEARSKILRRLVENADLQL